MSFLFHFSRPVLPDFGKMVIVERVIGYLGRNVLYDRMCAELMAAAFALEDHELYSKDVVLARNEEGALMYMCLRSYTVEEQHHAHQQLRITIGECHDLPSVLAPHASEAIVSEYGYEKTDVTGKKVLFNVHFNPFKERLVSKMDELMTLMNNYLRKPFTPLYKSDIGDLNIVHNSVWKKVKTFDFPFKPSIVYAGGFAGTDARALHTAFSAMIREVHLTNRLMDEQDFVELLEARKTGSYQGWISHRVLSPTHLTETEQAALCSFRYNYKIGCLGSFFEVVELDFFGQDVMGYVDLVAGDPTRYIMDPEPVIVRRRMIHVLAVQLTIGTGRIPKKFRSTYALKWYGTYNGEFDRVVPEDAAKGLMTLLGQMQQYAVMLYVEYIIRDSPIGSKEWLYWVDWLLKNPVQQPASVFRQHKRTMKNVFEVPVKRLRV